MKKFSLFVAFLFLSLFTLGQNTSTLTGTVTDSDAQTWNYATWTAKIFNPVGTPAVYTSNGQPVPLTQNGRLDASGNFSGTLPNNTAIKPDGTQWIISVCSLTSAPCQTLPAVQVSGASFNLGSYVSSQITAPRISGTSNTVPSQPLVDLFAYNTTEITNVVNGTGYTNTTNYAIYIYNGTWQPTAVSTGTVSGTQYHVGAFSNANTINNTNMLTDSSGNNFTIPGYINAQKTNNVVEAAFYPAGPAGDCGSRITNASDANFGTPTTINVSQLCGMTIQDSVFLAPGHKIKFTQGGTWDIGSAVVGPHGGGTAIYLNTGGSIEGIGPSTVLRIVPGAASQNNAVVIMPGYWNSGVSNVRIAHLKFDGNSSAYLQGDGFSDYPIAIRGANDTVTAGPSYVNIEDVDIVNTNGNGISIGQTVLANPYPLHDIFLNNVRFNNGYLYMLHISGGVQNLRATQVDFRNYMAKFSVPISAATSSDGTHITLTSVSPVPRSFTTSNGGFIFVSGCSDSHYNVAFSDGATSQLDSVSGSTLTYHNLTGGAAGSATGCTVQLQNAQAPLRGDLSSTAPTSNVVLDHITMKNDNHAQEYGIELYGDVIANGHLSNSILDANNSFGGNGLSMSFTSGSVENNSFLNGTSGQLGNGCECGGSDNLYIGNHVYGGAIGAAVGNNVVISDNDFTGCQTNGSIFVANLTNATIANNSINNTCSSNGAAITVGWEGGNAHFANVIVKNNVIHMNGSLNSGIVFGGDNTSSNLFIGGNSITNAGNGVYSFNNPNGTFPTVSRITISKNDLTGTTLPFALGGATGVILEDNLLPGVSKVDTESQTGHTIYNHLNLVPMQRVGTGNVVIIGIPGSTPWSYTCVGYDAYGNNTAPYVINLSDTATLSAAHSHYVFCPVFEGATTTRIWRTNAGGAAGTAGKVVDTTNPAATYYDLTGTTTIDASTPPGAAVGSGLVLNVNGTPGATKTCTVLPTVVNGIVTGC